MFHKIQGLQHMENQFLSFLFCIFLHTSQKNVGKKIEIELAKIWGQLDLFMNKPCISGPQAFCMRTGFVEDRTPVDRSGSSFGIGFSSAVSSLCLSGGVCSSQEGSSICEGLKPLLI